MGGLGYGWGSGKWSFGLRHFSFLYIMFLKKLRPANPYERGLGLPIRALNGTEAGLNLVELCGTGKNSETLAL